MRSLDDVVQKLTIRLVKYAESLAKMQVSHDRM